MTCRVEIHNRAHGWVTVHKDKPKLQADDIANKLRCEGRDVRVTCEAPADDAPEEWR